MNARVVSGASTAYDSHPESSSRELFAEAGQGALDRAGLSPADLDAVYVGNFMGGLIEDQGHMGPLLADVVGARTAETMRLESACASGGATFRQAALAVESGAADAVLAGGVEVMSVADIEHVTDALANAADDIYENEQGLTFPGIYALMARRYLDEFNVDREALASVSVKNHGNAVANPLAQMGRELTVAEVLDSRPVATPLLLYDACPVSDGASAVVVTSEAFARDRGLNPSAAVRGLGASSDALALQDRASFTGTPAAERAARAAYDAAGVGPEDVDIAEVHDCFTIAEVLALEALGFADRGEGWRGAVEGETAVDGALPVNTSGGLLGKGHPVGVTGIGQIAELIKQFDGDHPNQVPDPAVGLAHNVGGSGASTTVAVLEAVR